MIYLDNAATSYPKPKTVIDEVKRCLEEYCGNAGRSGHRMSIISAEKIYSARENLCSHLSFDFPERVVFTYNATYALNLAIRALINENDEVLISDLEHNSVVRPLELLKKEKNIDYKIFSTEKDIQKNIESLISKKTKAIISTLSSNVTGKSISASVLSCVARKYGLKLILDASQALGHENISLSNLCFDALCGPGHKGLFGIQGSGFVVFGNEKPNAPFIAGGSGSESRSLNMPRFLPDRYEAGTLSTPAIASLNEGISFIDNLGIKEVAFKENMLANRLKEGLSLIKGTKLYDTEGAIVLFNFKGKESEELCSKFDRFGIYTRGGLHCSPLAHKSLKTEKSGALRLSVSYFNTLQEIDVFLNIANKIAAEC